MQRRQNRQERPAPGHDVTVAWHRDLMDAAAGLTVAPGDPYVDALAAQAEAGKARRPVIVCGVDESAEARRALDATIDLARRIDVRPVIIRVGNAPMRREVERAELVAWAGASGPPRDTEYQVVYGVPADSLVDAADEFGAMLIVVGSRARGRIATALRGSVSAAIIQNAGCPVLVVPATAG